MATGDWSSGNLLAACCGSSIQVWAPLASSSSPGGRPPLVYETRLESVVTSVRWSPNRRAVAYGDASGTFYTLAGGKAFGATMAPFKDGITSLRFSHDCRRLFVASGREAHVLDVKNQAVDRTFSDHRGALVSLAIDPRDELLATACTDGAVVLRSLSSPEGPAAALCRPDGAPKVSLVFSPSGDGLLAAGTSGGAAVMRWADGRAHAELLSVEAHAGRVMGVSFSGAHALVGCCDDGGVLVWDLRSKAAALRVALPSAASCVCAKGDELVVAAGTADGWLHLVDFRASRTTPIGRCSASQPPPGGAGGGGGAVAAVAECHWQPPPRSVAAAAGPMVTAAAAATAGDTGVSLSVWHSGGAAAAAGGGALQHPPEQRAAGDGTGPTAAQSGSGGGGDAARAARDQTSNPGRASSGAPAASDSPDLGKAAAAGAAAAAAAAAAAVAASPGARAHAAIGAPPPLPAHTTRPAGAHSGVSAGGAAAALPLPSLSSVSAVEHSVSGARDDIRNLHVEVLRQFHVMQTEQHALLQQLATGQEKLATRVEALATQVNALARQRVGAALM